MALPQVVGTDHVVSLATGMEARVVLLNNAATTPPFKATLDAVNDFLSTYGALNRGAGPHATITCNRVQEAVSAIRAFLSLGPDQVLLFREHTTSAINLFVRICALERSDVVLTSPTEHTSNNLPWRFNTQAEIIEAKAADDGTIDYDDLERKAQKYGRRLKVVALNGASNTTGYLTNIKRASGIAHRYGALLFIDAAQLAPARRIDMSDDGIDALAFSAHKVYAPFGTGVLVVPGKLLKDAPIEPGGGTVDMVSDTDVIWKPLPAHRYQAGTWNAVGIVALGASCQAITKATWDAVVAHERGVVEYAVKRLLDVEGIKIHIAPEKYKNNRLGIFPFNLYGYHHMLVSAILGHEYGVETRAGAICNHRVVRRWFDVTDSVQRKIESEISTGNRLASYGIVRASLGVHNTREDIDLLADALSEIERKGPRLKYTRVPEEEMFIPAE